VTPPHLPPTSVDPLEDWVWGAASPRDVDARVAALERRARRGDVPAIDEAGRLRVDGATVLLTPMEAVLAGRLLRDFGEVVGREALRRAAWPRGRVRERTLDTHMMRLRRHLAGVGLAVRTIRARGWLLERLDRTTLVAAQPA
jgi:DNA-binding response OmpR family regulator